MKFLLNFHSSPITHSTHQFCSPGPETISLVLSYSCWQDSHQPSNPLICPLTMTKTDSTTKQSICISFSDVQKYHEKASVVIVPQLWNNRVIRQSAIDLGRQLIHLPIYLNYFLWNGYQEKLYNSFILQWQFHFFSPSTLYIYFPLIQRYTISQSPPPTHTLNNQDQTCYSSTNGNIKPFLPMIPLLTKRRQE